LSSIKIAAKPAKVKSKLYPDLTNIYAKRKFSGETLCRQFYPGYADFDTEGILVFAYLKARPATYEVPLSQNKNTENQIILLLSKRKMWQLDFFTCCCSFQVCKNRNPSCFLKRKKNYCNIE